MVGDDGKKTPREAPCGLKAEHRERIEAEHALVTRLNQTEWQVENIEKRLKDGAETFGEVKRAIAEVRKEIGVAYEKFREAIAPKPISPLRVLAIAFPIFVVVAAWIWQAASYPGRGEFDRLRDDQAELRANQMLIRESVDRQEAHQRDVNKKLDRLLDVLGDNR